jgi:Flp pilus assembly protein TadD
MPSVHERYDEAIELQQQGKLEEAMGKLTALIAECPDYALGHAALSVFYGKLGRHEEAIEHAKKVCELEPDDSFSFMAMSLICQRAGKRSEAEEAMGQAMEKQWAAQRGQ